RYQQYLRQETPSEFNKHFQQFTSLQQQKLRESPLEQDIYCQMASSSAMRKSPIQERRIVSFFLLLNRSIRDEYIVIIQVSGQPVPQVHWFYADETPIKEGGKFRIVNYGDGSSQFHIDKCSMDDANSYLCIAENGGGIAKARFYLTVYEQKQSKAPQFVGKFQSVTIFEGDSVTLFCKASGDGVKTSWLKDGVQITPSPKYNGETTLHIIGAKMADGGWYQCTATNKEGTSSIKGRVVVQARHKPTPSTPRETVVLRKVDRRSRTPQQQPLDVVNPLSKEPPRFLSTLKNLNLIEGQTALLECQFSPTNDPNLKIAWLLNGKALLASSRLTTISDFGRAMLELNPVTVFDRGEYTLIAVNTMGEAHTSNLLSVISSPQQTTAGKLGGVQSTITEQPNFHSDLKSEEVFAGSDVHLEAKLTPINDPNLIVEWLFNGEVLKESPKYRMLHEHGFAVLDIFQVTDEDSGVYTCRATNFIGTTETYGTVVVHQQPVVASHMINNVMDVEDARELQYARQHQAEAPKFQLQDFCCDRELGMSSFEARILPANDPTLQIIWLKDGKPIPMANRIQTFHSFGCVSLTLNPTYPEDAGEYTCVLRNAFGEQHCSARLTTVQPQSLQLDTAHEESLAQIDYLEGHQVHIGPQEIDRPEEFNSMEPPHFARPLPNVIEVDENEPVHFECRLQPASDVKMTVEWYHNGKPLPAAHRFKPMFDFGYVALDIFYVYPEDSGVYTLVASNELGQIESNLELIVHPQKTLYTEPQHPEGLDRIQELEQGKVRSSESLPDRECDGPPMFIGDFEDLNLLEGDDLHLELRVEPVNDPTMVVEWFVNGRPLSTGSRIKPQFDFGFISVDLHGVIAEDSGVYSVRAKNGLGESIKECTINVTAKIAIVSDSQHEESLDKIYEIEHMKKYERAEVMDKVPEEAPSFAQLLESDLGEIEEGTPVHLECQVRPVGDNTLTVIWLKDGKPLATGYRFRTFHDFGYVSLDILDVYAEDSGTYTCVARNAYGEARSSSTFFSAPAKSAIIGQTNHPASIARIQEIEAPKHELAETQSRIFQAPQFVKPLGNGNTISVTEGDNVYLEAQITPIDDSTLTYEWLLNNRPLMKAHRFVLTHDFGYIALNILYVYPEDSGTYTLVIKNASGESQSSVDIDCAVKGSTVTESFHPNSIQRIQELEMPLQKVEQPEKPLPVAPQIVKTLPAVLDHIYESQTLHLEAQILPIDDNDLKVEWYHNDQPLKASSRYRLMNDFGFVSLDIDYVNVEDAGTYTLVVTNSQGRAETSTQFNVLLLKNILSDTQHPESLKRIQEIESMQPAKPDEEDYVPEQPVFTQELQGPTEVLKEGQSVHMDCMLQPINDPNLKIEWFLNGHPILFGSRIRTMHDFGYVGLEFLHIHPEDSGTYVCKAINNAGEATTEFVLQCKPLRNIYLDTQHAESWARIQEMENTEIVREPSPDQTFMPPTFIQSLQDVENLKEGDSVRLECRLQPVNDPTLRVIWERNGNPIPEGSRFMPARNFDYVTLDLLAVYGEDSGIYTCRAISEFGESAISCTVKCQQALLLDTQHEQSWCMVQEIENKKPEEAIVEEPEKIAPYFVTELPSQLGEFSEGSPIHIEGQIEPTNDNKLTVEWHHNGNPLANGHRFRTTHDFGYISLDILYAFPEDTGEWTCVLSNELGIFFNTLYYLIYTQHPESLMRIQEIESRKIEIPEAQEKQYGAPQFTMDMESLQRIENQPAHFETRVTPIDDPKLKIVWYKDGAPLLNSNRFRHTADFGFIALDIAYTLPEDTGIYTVMATNDEGEDSTSASLKIEEISSILGNVQHEDSWRRIQEMEQPKEADTAEHEAAQELPHFVRQLNSVTNLIEGQPAHFETLLEPINDSNMEVTWYFNGTPVTASSRKTIRNDFGLCTLDIHYVLAEDIGQYTCIAKNLLGEDKTEGSLECQTRASIISDVQHAESWRRIQEIEAPKQGPAAAPAPVYGKPVFTQPLQSIADVLEGSVAVLEARLIPVNDPNLQIQWFCDDAPLQQSNWMTLNNDFGYITLRIAPVFTHHAGVYVCKAVNEQGTAITSASLTILDTQHPESLMKIQELESLNKYPKMEIAEEEFGKPVWTKSFDNIENLPEDGIILLNGMVEPSSDPHLKIEWYHNGAPLRNSNRYRQENDFGNVSLTIVHVVPEDSGVYTCKAINRSGDASTSATVKIPGYEKILNASQHPISWEKIQLLETPVIVEKPEEIVQTEKPHFLTQLESVTDVTEGEPVHLEATFQPARDSNLKVTWLRNNAPIGASQLVKIRSELGWTALDINDANVDHNGIYTLKIVNDEGEATTSASIGKVADVLTDTAHEESWRRIQEIEAPREKTPEMEPVIYEAPIIQTQLSDATCIEGEPSHFEAMIAPVNDPDLTVAWLHNGQPLAHGSKFAISQDLGLCTLDIGYTYPEDEGIYQLQVVNDSGKAISSATLKCQGTATILTDTQHEQSWKRIQELEAPKAPAPELPIAPKVAPKFITVIKDIGDLSEGQPAHFEATIEPIDDPELVVQWYHDGSPVAASSRLKMISDFGWIILDINQAATRDSGEWTCVAKNAIGEANCSATITVLGKENILLNSLQPQSLNRIREIESVKPGVEEVYDAPQIITQLSGQTELSEGDSVHLECQYEPFDDPNLKVGWFKDDKPLLFANRYKIIQDFGFAILDILHLFSQDSGRYVVRVTNNSGSAETAIDLDVAAKESLLLGPQDENKAQAIFDLEKTLNQKPEEAVVDEQKTVPVFIEPLSAPVLCEEGERVHFAARYEPINDNKLQIHWYLDGKPLRMASRMKTINDFGFVVLEIYPTYPEDSGEYTCRASNNVGEAVTSTQLVCSPKHSIITSSQLPESMSDAQKKIVELEAPKAQPLDKPDLVFEAPVFITQLQDCLDLVEGQVAHFEVQVNPVGDPKLGIEWLHNGKPIAHSSRMKNIHDFGFVVLELSPVEPQDSGTWTCRAFNEHGEAEVSCDIAVKGMSGIVYDWQSSEERKERITQLEDWMHRPKEYIAPPAKEYDAPKFTQELQDLGQLKEADAIAFTCILEPVGDPSLKIEWQHNGHAIPYSNRIQMTNEFGVVCLLIKHLIAQDSGEYRCIARNAKGQAETIGYIKVETLVEIEKPTIIEPLVESIDGEEESIHLECRISPINDPKLSIYWLKDGVRLPEASRFRYSSEFGFVTFDILYAYPEDSGEYKCVAENDMGEVFTTCILQVLPKPSLEFSPQAPGNTLENLGNHMRMHTRAELALSKEDAYDEGARKPPEFKTNLTNIGVEEGDYCRFETQVAPVNDPYLKIEWYKDKKPVLIGHRFRSTLDFGFACLDILYALPDDTGEYVCVATNKYGHAMISANLACAGTKHIITEPQLPQGVLVADVKKLGDHNSNKFRQEQTGDEAREKQAPHFTIKPRDIQVVENEPARFECAVIGNPKPKVIWYINGNQALHGQRYKLNYDGMFYLTVTNTRISDSGEIVAIAKNSEGEVLASCMLDVFQKKDFRQVKLKPTVFKTIDEVQARETQWQKETLGVLGEAFENAPKPDQQKLLKIERSQAPVEPLESQELIDKFAKPKSEGFYDHLNYVDARRGPYKGLELEQVSLKPGKLSKYEPPQETMESVQLKATPRTERVQPPTGAAVTQPTWATDKKLGHVQKGINPLPPVSPETEVPARDQIRLKAAKPKRPDEFDHVEIEREKAKLAPIVQKPEPPVEEEVAAKDQVTIRQMFHPKQVKPVESTKIETEPLKGIPPVPQPTKLGQSQRISPNIQMQLKPVQAEIGRGASFTCGFDGAEPATVIWLKQGKEIKPSFRFQILTTAKSSTLKVSKLTSDDSGEYVCRIQNVAGTVESLASLTVVPAADRGVVPNFKSRMNDARVGQNKTVEFSCDVTGFPTPVASWFKDGKAFPNDQRFQMISEGDTRKLIITSAHTSDTGIYECVIKNTAGEARCKARLNVILSTTGQGVEMGPKLEAPRFQTQIQPLVGQEGGEAEFRAKFSGVPTPTIRWYRNNEPLKSSKYYVISQDNNEAVLRILECYQEDVGEYKCEAVNTAGRAASVANFVLQRSQENIFLAKTYVNDKKSKQNSPPQFVSKLTDISSRPGHTVRFIAEISGNPQPSVAWQFNNKPLYEGRDHKISQNGDKVILEIQRVSVANAGSYSVTIRNPLGVVQCQAKLKIESR
uniref:Immunoglobulin I-set domain protein n=1 Tax=Syphacia muris TaxID=451379 RepID=A0A0N5ALN5_9BILA